MSKKDIGWKIKREYGIEEICKFLDNLTDLKECKLIILDEVRGKILDG